MCVCLAYRRRALQLRSVSAVDTSLPVLRLIRVSCMRQILQCSCCVPAAEVREVMGKDGKMKKVRRKVKVNADGSPVAQKVSARLTLHAGCIISLHAGLALD